VLAVYDFEVEIHRLPVSISTSRSRGTIKRVMVRSSDQETRDTAGTSVARHSARKSRPEPVGCKFGARFDWRVGTQSRSSGILCTMPRPFGPSTNRWLKVSPFAIAFPKHCSRSLFWRQSVARLYQAIGPYETSICLCLTRSISLAHSDIEGIPTLQIISHAIDLVWGRGRGWRSQSAWQTGGIARFWRTRRA